LICRAKGFLGVGDSSKNRGGLPGRRDTLFLKTSCEHKQCQKVHLPSMEGQRALFGPEIINHWPKSNCCRCVSCPVRQEYFFLARMIEVLYFKALSVAMRFCLQHSINRAKNNRRVSGTQLANSKLKTRWDRILN